LSFAVHRQTDRQTTNDDQNIAPAYLLWSNEKKLQKWKKNSVTYSQSRELEPNVSRISTVYSLETKRYGLGLGTQVFKYYSASRLRRTTIKSKQLDSLSLFLSLVNAVGVSLMFLAASNASVAKKNGGRAGKGGG